MSNAGLDSDRPMAIFTPAGRAARVQNAVAFCVESGPFDHSGTSPVDEFDVAATGRACAPVAYLNGKAGRPRMRIDPGALLADRL
jgi:hypothetical protein